MRHEIRGGTCFPFKEGRDRISIKGQKEGRSFPCRLIEANHGSAYAKGYGVTGNTDDADVVRRSPQRTSLVSHSPRPLRLRELHGRRCLPDRDRSVGDIQ